MSRFVAAGLAVAGVALTLAAGQPPPATTAWPFDEITLKNGAKFEGLILRETPGVGIEFQTVRRPPGRPTVTLTTFFGKAEIHSVRPLADADRAVLKERLAELDPSGEGERKRMETLDLTSVEWLGRPKAARCYGSDYFSFVSPAPDEVVRRSAVKLEQIYTAFARFLPPTVPAARPTVVLLAPDQDAYAALLGRKVLNPAVFDPAGNRILCGSELGKLGAELQATRMHHSQELVSLSRYEEGVKKLYKKPELDRYLDTVNAERKRVVAADRANGLKFDQATARLFAILYHEAFHAYAATFVYPPLPPERVKAGAGTGELPRWLNEGLAQVFETAVVEAGELRADHPDKDRLTRVKDALKGKNGAALVPLTDLLVAGKDSFLAHHADQTPAADRAYLTSWALAYYLTFDRRVVGTPAFKQYLTAANSGDDPREAFGKLVDQDLPAFERQWHDFLSRLRPDGTTGR